MSLEAAYNTTRAQIAALARQHGVREPRLVAVSKYKTATEIQALYDLGHRHFGENYVQELVAKVEALPKDICWHFIGALQTNKCKVLGPIANLWAVETVDSVTKASKLDASRSSDDPRLGIFVQVNTSGEEQKAGLSTYDEILQLALHITQNCPKLDFKGLMTIGSATTSTAETEINADFEKLVSYREVLAPALKIPVELSMGMSADYAQAIKQGSTNVRVGSAIFGAREKR